MPADPAVTFEKCRPIFELKVTLIRFIFRVSFILSALQTTEWSITSNRKVCKAGTTLGVQTVSASRP